MSALSQAAQMAETSYQLEHVTPFLYQNAEQYPLLSIKLNASELTESSTETSNTSALRLCVDEADDLALIEALMAQYPEAIIDATAAEIIDFLHQHADIAKINQQVVQKSH